MTNKISITKNLIIGLGGAGVRSVLKAKAECFDNWFKIPRQIQFAMIDTDVLPSELPKFTDPEINFVDDFLYLKVNNPNYFVKTFDEIGSSIPTNNRHLLDPLNNGAGQVRSRGRFAFAVNYFQIRNYLRKKIGMITDFYEDEKFNFDESNIIHIAVITSFAGGTGAGMFVDMQYLIREIADELRIKIYLKLIFILPEVYQGLPATRLININTYASLMECELLSGDFFDKSFQKIRENGLDLPYVEATRKINHDDQFYDIFIPVDKFSDVIFDNVGQLTDFIGRQLFITMVNVGGMAESSLKNAKIHIKNKNQMGGVEGKLFYRMNGMEYSDTIQYPAPFNALINIEKYADEYQNKYLNELKNGTNSSSVISPFITQQIEDAIMESGFSFV